MKFLNNIIKIILSLFEEQNNQHLKLTKYIKYDIKTYSQQMKDFNKELIESMPWYRKNKE